MGGFDADNAIYAPRVLNQEIYPDLLRALSDRVGPRSKSTTNPVRALADASLALPWDDIEQDLAAIVAALIDPFSANAAQLPGFTWPIDEPQPAKTAAGTIELDYIKPFTSPSPLVARNDATFIDINDREYTPDADIPVPEVLNEKTGTGTASQTIATTGLTKIAWKIPAFTDKEYLQGVRFLINHVSGTPTVTLRIETDSSGVPSGTLKDADLEDTGITPANGTAHFEGFPSGAYTDEDGEVLWLVLTCTAGSFTVDGSASGTAGDVKVWNGSNYVDDANIKAFNGTIYAGGVVAVTASAQGAAGNISAESIVDVSLATTAAQTNWDDNVQSDGANNTDAFVGGADAETAREARNRIRFERAARPGGSIPGLERALKNTVGVLDAKVGENKTTTAGTDETAYDGSADTGTNSETIDATTPFIAARFTPTQRTFVQHVALTLNSNNAFEGTVSIQSESGGDPGGLLATGTTTAAGGYDPAATAREVVVLNDGVYLEVGTTYFVVIQRTSGDGQFDGDIAATLLTNGGFETYTTTPGAPDSWSDASGGNATLDKETTIVRTGTNAVKITAGATPSANEGIKQALTTTAERYYRVAAWARTGGSAGERARLLIRNTTDSVDTVTADGTDATTTYEELEVTFQAVDGKSYEVHLIHTPTAATGEIVYFDDSIAVASNVLNSTDGSTWAADNGIDDMNVEVIGGIPPKSGRAVVRAGSATNIAKTLILNRMPGNDLSGDTSGTATVDGVEYTEWFRRPTAVPVVIDVAIETRPAYPGGDDPAKDVLVEYVGGTDSDDVFHEGEGLGGELVIKEAIGRLQDDNLLPGVKDTTTFRVARKSAVASPDLLTSSHEVNLTATDLEYFEVTSPSVDIRITRTEVS